MLSLGVLVSGSGTNLGAVLAAIDRGALDARVRVVVANKPGAGALARAQAAGVPTEVLVHRDYPAREDFDRAVAARLRAHGVDTVLLAGFMRVVTPALLDAFPARVLNVHPSLLPAFPGLDAQGQALAHGVRVAGCTVHFVDAGTDTGPILAQAAVPVHDDDTVEALRARILAAEHRLVPAALQWLAEGRVELDGRRVRVRGARGEFAVAAPPWPEAGA